MLCNWLVQAAVALRERWWTADPQIARQFIADAARTHGRIQILNEESAKESTGHGSPLPQLDMVGLVAQEAVKN
ncbi:bifunctional aldehyde dehydrogenase/enoyl-CoA hydratase [Escherichia coli]|nr:bifunctional aldehyde dehydrogenase/enoyl-CoA hydratase [Escherichia coli]